jgi:hypothetical protein
MWDVREEEKCVQGSWRENLKGKDYLEDLGVDGKMDHICGILNLPFATSSPHKSQAICPQQWSQHGEVNKFGSLQVKVLFKDLHC